MDATTDPQARAVIQKFFDFNQTCYTKCVESPDKRLTPKQENCFSKELKRIVGMM